MKFHIEDTAKMYGCGVLFVHGELKEKLPYDELLPALLRYIDAM